MHGLLKLMFANYLVCIFFSFNILAQFDRVTPLRLEWSLVHPSCEVEGFFHCPAVGYCMELRIKSNTFAYGVSSAVCLLKELQFIHNVSLQ